jgi:hypothetical protein
MCTVTMKLEREMYNSGKTSLLQSHLSLFSDVLEECRAVDSGY